MKKWEKIYLIICSTIIVIGILFLSFWAFWPTKVMEVKNPVKVDKKVYNIGDTIVYTLDYCKYANVSGTLYRSLADGIIIPYTTTTNFLPTGCHVYRRNDLVVPLVSSGVYHLETRIEYKINPLKTVFINWWSEDFDIINNLDENTKNIEKNTEQIEINANKTDFNK